MKNFAFKIRKRIVLPIIAVVFAMLCVFGLVACGNEAITEEDIINMGYKISVVFDYRGGTVNEKGQTQIRIKEGSKIPNPASSGNKLSLPVRSGYSFRRFCVAKTNSSGELERDADGYLVPGEAWNFNTVPTKDVTLCAEWWDSYKLLLHYGENGNLSKTTYISRTVSGAPTSISSTAFTASDYTMLDYYTDSAMTEANRIEDVSKLKLTSADFEASEDKLTYNVWAHSLEGSYQVIRSAIDFAEFTMTSETNIYMYNNVDMQELYDAKKSFSIPATYGGKFIGNGYTIKNMKVEQETTSISDYYYGLFKDVSSSAVISDVTFEDATVTVNFTNTLISQLNVGLFAGRVNADAQIKNVHVSGVIDYTVASGYKAFDHLTVNSFIGEVQSGAKIENSGMLKDGDADKITVNGCKVVEATGYAVYVKTTQTGNGDTVIGDVINLATIKADGSYGAINGITVEKLSDGKYKLEQKRVSTVMATYTVTLNNNGGTLTATVEKV